MPEPRKVTVSFYINSITKISSIEGACELTFQLYFQWFDPALKGVPIANRPPPSECWNPEIEVNNGSTLQKEWELYPPNLQDAEKGMVVGAARYTGMVFNKMNLRYFPLDAALICIKVGPKELCKDECMLQLDTSKHRKHLSSLVEHFPGDHIRDSTVEDWSLDIPFAKLTTSGPTGSGRYYSNAVLEFAAYRNVGYYVWKVWLVSNSFVVFSWIVLWYPPEEKHNDRIQIVLTLMLSVVAFLFVVDGSLPKIIGAGIESFIVYLFARNDHDEIAATIDDYAKVAFPGSHFLCMACLVLQGYYMRWSDMGTHCDEENYEDDDDEYSEEEQSLL